MTAPEQDWTALDRALAGTVIVPGSHQYDGARAPQIPNFRDVNPLAVVRCGSADDVATTLEFVRRHRLPFAVRSGGHCFAGRSSTDGVLIDVSPMRGISLVNGKARIGAGARLGDVYDALSAHRVTLAAGCGPTVGIAGLALGGGIGIIGRMHGLTCDQVRGAEVVLADGRVVQCDEEREVDLFWALRGGGSGTLGVVTSLAVRTVPAPAMTTFHLTWPSDRAAAVIDAWQHWAPDAPDEIAPSLLVSMTGEREPVISVFGAMAGSEDECRAMLGTLDTGTPPAEASYTHGSHRDTKRLLTQIDVHGTGPQQPESATYMLSKSEYFERPLPADAVTALVGHLTGARRAGEDRELDFSPLLGAYARTPADATAFVHRSDRFLLKQAATVPIDAPDEQRATARDWLRRSWELVHPHGTGRSYQNFPDPDLPDPAAAYFGTNLDRLRTVKQTYDPDGLFLPLGS